MGWVYETAGDQVISQLRSWRRREQKKLDEEMQAALNYADTLEGEKLKVFLKKMQKRISVRRNYIDNTNFGSKGASSYLYSVEMHPKPDLITGKETKPQ
jgi:hypothetical protein